jgi:N-sulfoglucosamine sulfohydrolase
MRNFIFVSIFCFIAKPLLAAERPNILFFFVDDWGRYASIYSDKTKPSMNDIVKTPHFDRVGREGVVFENAFMHVSSCTPSRASLTTGRYFWNCGSHAFLHANASDWSQHPDPFSSMQKFPDLLRESGYYARKSQKTIDFQTSAAGRDEKSVPSVKYQRYGQYVSQADNESTRSTRIQETLDHPRFEMRRVLNGRPSSQPFFFIYGTINVHRPYHADSGRNLWGIDPESLKGRLPKFIPDVEDSRRDFADYLGEIQAADAMLGVMLGELEAAGELDKTLIILSGDNGMPGVPRGKTNCYDLSVRAPLIARWPAGIKAGRRVEDFVSLVDIGPTLLEIAQLPIPSSMEGKSFHRQLVSSDSGWMDSTRDSVVIGRERHVDSARAGNIPYPMRAIRTKDYLYIRNFKPERWPVGDPDNVESFSSWNDGERHAKGPFRDVDESLTKAWLINNRQNPQAVAIIELTFNKRPREELYLVSNDPDQMLNLATDPAHADTKKQLSDQLDSVLRKSNDPRLTDSFDQLPYVTTNAKQKSGRKK